MFFVMMMKIVIDIAYFDHYRYYATKSWYDRCPERKEYAYQRSIKDNHIFMSMFKKKWFETMDTICRKFNVEKEELVIACEGGNSWRNDVFKDYKANRKANGDLFDILRYSSSELQPKLGAKIVKIPRAEGDCCIAVITKTIREKCPLEKIVIITADRDIVQLSEPPFTRIFEIKGGIKEITDPEPDILVMKKILSGDPSDNIPQAFPRCGKITADKLAKGPFENIEKQLEKFGSDQFRINTILIDFNCIPDEISQQIQKHCQDIGLF